jgi:hypothetical protein
VSISSTFNSKLLNAQIPKVPKDSDDLTEFLCFWLLASARVKAVLEMLVKLTPIVDFTYILQAAFMSSDLKSTKNVGEIDP